MDEQFKSEKRNEETITNIIKECYWDYNITENDILKIIDSDDIRLKQKLFTKIVYNSKDKLKGLQIFKSTDLKELFNSMSPVYREKYIKKHILVLRNILLNENNKIESLEWKKK
jgi:hypothetical protein